MDMIRGTAHLAICVLVLGISASNVVARTWYIKADGTGDAPTIQAGVDSAAAGDTVLVGPGTYTDTTHVEVAQGYFAVNVHVYKPITLLGEAPRPILGVVVDVKCAGIYINNVDSLVEVNAFNIIGNYEYLGCIIDPVSAPSIQTAQSAGVGIICRSSRVVVENSLTENVGIGVSIEAASQGTLRGNEHRNSLNGVLCQEDSHVELTNNTFATCILAINSQGSTVTILENEIVGEGNDFCTGIGCWMSRVRIANNRIHGPKFEGVACKGQTRGVIEQNVIENTLKGVYLEAADSMIVRDNIMRNVYYLDVLSTRSAIIESNTFDGFNTGVFCQVGTDPTIRNNIFVHGYYGVSCDAGATPTVECNNIFQVDVSYRGCPDYTGVNGNISVDPEFCGIDDSGNYFLQSDSPCAPGNHPDGYDCGLIGALPVNCGKVDVEKKSWGTIKSLYRNDK